MKAKGVTTGMPVWDVLPLCPEAIFVKRDFEWYETLSRRMLEVVDRFSPTVEFYSIDEMFFDAGTMDLADARRLQESIRRETGIPVSVGVSRSKILAKLASSSGKPFGCTMAVEEADIGKLLVGRPVEKITGIAWRSAKKLLGYGIRTCEEFVAADRRLIRRLLTKHGEDLWWELNGAPALPIQASRAAHKVISRGGSLGIATASPDRLTGWVARNTERLIEALDHHEVDCSVLALSLQFKDGGAASWRSSLPAATADFFMLYEAGLALLRRCWRPGAVVSYMHLFAEQLTGREFAQRSLFDAPSPRQRAIAEVKRRINERIGRFALRSGATLPLQDLYADETASYDICDIYGKTCF
jgi:nucleotidyltransferase/DNA polymerase involved in DNA repair